jgi:rare lipoprotein A
MNKIVPLLLIFVLCGCTAEQIKTSDFSDQTSVTTAHQQSGSDAANTDEENLLPRIARYLKQGIASWYGSEFHGKKTASGEIYDMYAMTAAHNTLPISSYARVTNLENHRSVIVRINDRGPFHGNRVMDLSYAAAKRLDIQQAGSGAVEIKAIAPEQALAQMQTQTASQIPNKGIYLQVGTFSNKKKAQNLQHKIAAHHLPPPKILPSTRNRSTLYKVQMGPIESLANVRKLNNQLAKLGITATQFVAEADQKQIAMLQ